MSPTISIVINNYNYGRYLQCAIESALAQTYPQTEVIVVDDGSTDDSRSLIAAYGRQVIPVLQANGGQAAAMNAGFARSRGELVIFLDADDMLHPQIAEQVAAHFELHPAAVRAQYRLAVVDAQGAPTGEMKPPRHAPIPAGDLRAPVLLYGDDLPWLPTSGNVFAAETLRQIFPIPVAGYRICADYYLSNLTPLFGCVMALDVTGGYYRVHGHNHHQRTRLDLAQMRQNIVRTAQTHVHLQATAARRGMLRGSGAVVGGLSLSFLANRLVSLRLDPGQHPLSEDRAPGARWALARRGMRAALGRPQLPLAFRLLYLLWFLVQAMLPSDVAVHWLAEQLFFPKRQGWMRK